MKIIHISLFLLLTHLSCKKECPADQLVGNYCSVTHANGATYGGAITELTKKSANQVVLTRGGTIPKSFIITVGDDNHLTIEYQKFMFNANSTCEDVAISGDGEFYPNESKIVLNFATDFIACSNAEIHNTTDSETTMIKAKVETIDGHYEDDEMEADIKRNADGSYSVYLDYHPLGNLRYKYNNIKTTAYEDGCIVNFSKQYLTELYSNSSEAVEGSIRAAANAVVISITRYKGNQEDSYPIIFLYK